MAGFTVSKTIHAPLETVFATLGTSPDGSRRSSGSSCSHQARSGWGTRFKETRIVFKREATETFEFTAYEPNRRYELTAVSCGAHSRTEFLFSPGGGDTRLHVTFEVTAVSVFARLFALLARLMMETMRKCLVDDLDALRKVVETRPHAA